MSNLNRRGFLQSGSLLLVAGIAGCTVRTENSGTCKEATPTLLSSVSLPIASGGETSGELPVEVLNARVTESLLIWDVVAVPIKTSEGISNEEGESLQFLEVALDIDDEDRTETETRRRRRTRRDPESPSPEGVRAEDLDVSLDLDGETYHPPFSSTLVQQYSPFSEGESIGMAIPMQDVDQASVHFETDDRTATWQIPEELLGAFTAVPSFSVQDSSLTLACGPSSDELPRILLEATVENTGDRNGLFQATAHTSHVSDEYLYVSVPVPAGESVRGKDILKETSPGGTHELEGWSEETRVFEFL